MDSKARSAPRPAAASMTLPPWTLAHARVTEEADIAFLAGSALNSLDNLVRSEPEWAGAWRGRLALKCAAAAARLLGRSEDEAALRDAVLLRSPSDNAGPAGNVLLAYKKLTGRVNAIDADMVREIAELLALRWDDGLSDVPGVIAEVSASGRAAPFVVTALVTQVVALRADAEVLAWWLADWMLAKSLGWNRPVPLLMAERYGPAFKASGGRGRVLCGDETFSRAVCLALTRGATDALRLSVDLGRRGEHLMAVAPKVRTKGAGAVIRGLLSEDAISASAPAGNLSRWASRRLFERLQSLDAVRELSGRTTFRIYGL